MHVQTAAAAQWWARPRGDAATWITNYQNSLNNRHRDVISRIVGEVGATSVLEVGCHCGPNLIRLAQDHPEIGQLAGVDVNAQAIAAGTSWAASLGLADRIEFVTGAIPLETQKLPDRCVDVVLSCYALAYQAPNDLDAMLWEMGRLARLAVILAEPMTDGAQSVSHAMMNGYQEWAHNYQAASQWINTWRGMTVAIHDVAPPVDRLSHVFVATRAESSPSPDAIA